MTPSDVLAYFVKQDSVLQPFMALLQSRLDGDKLAAAVYHARGSYERLSPEARQLMTEDGFKRAIHGMQAFSKDETALAAALLFGMLIRDFDCYETSRSNPHRAQLIEIAAHYGISLLNISIEQIELLEERIGSNEAYSDEDKSKLYSLLADIREK